MSEPRFKIRKLSISELLDEGFRLFLFSWKRLTVIQLVSFVPMTAFMVGWLLWFGTLVTDVIGTPDLESVVEVGVAFVALLVGTVVIQAGLGSLVYVAVIRAIGETYLDRPWTVRSALAFPLQRLGRIVAGGALIFLIILTATTIPLTVAAGGAGLTAFVTRSASTPLMILAASVVGLGLLLPLMVLAGIFVVRYLLTLNVIAYEETSLGGALSRSAALVKGRYGKALALLLILLAINMLLSGILTAFVPSPDFQGMDPDEVTRIFPQILRAQIYSAVAGQVAALFLQSFIQICWTLFYFSSRCEVEGFDLAYLSARGGGDADAEP